MEISEVRIKLMEDPHERLQAFCSITFDGCFVIRDLKIIQGTKGSFVAMPSRKLTDRCPRCGNKNHLRSQHCNQCGVKLDEERAVRTENGRAKLYADIAHPINSACREMIQRSVVLAYEEELIKSKQPGYVCTYDDYGEESFAALGEADESDYEEVTIKTSDDLRHRLEPAASGPGAPHGSSSVGGHREPSTVTARSASRNPEREERFGEGLV